MIRSVSDDSLHDDSGKIIEEVERLIQSVGDGLAGQPFELLIDSLCEVSMLDE